MRTLANSEDPDEMPHNEAFHQDLHCKAVVTGPALTGLLSWPSMLYAVSLFSRSGSFFFVLTSDFIQSYHNLLMQLSITLIARVINRLT